MINIIILYFLIFAIAYGFNYKINRIKLKLTNNYIYILKLEDKKYYVGKTKYIKNRINNHFTGNGALWTKKYKPIEVIEIINNCDDYDEDKYVFIMMNKYGIDNVRGGSFCNFKLFREEIRFLTNIINNANNNCFKCGKKGHFSNQCFLE